jgi:tRNA pseudouridine38-40 synthase
MHNIKLQIAYDGTSYLGWQKTKMGPSIEEALQQVIEQILQHPVSLQAASRTDAGVHAKGQIVNFLTSKIHLDLNKFRLSLNRLLPKDIVVLETEWMPISFHPTLDCIGKEYRYFICFGRTQFPQHRLYSWHVPDLLNLDHMQQALPLLIGRHHFASFCNVKKNASYIDYMREIQLLEMVEIEKNRLCFRIGGDHFLYKMVRNLVGTLVDIGRRKKTSLESLPDILKSGDRTRAGMTAPAHGLFLYEVFY